MSRRYQVFVSSTYEDLKKERQEVIQSLLEFDCIPVGMEFFPAADDNAWEVIKKVIEESDYYVVIVAGRYGSLTPEGISYTQREYQHAIEKGIPAIAFLHEEPATIPAGKTEMIEDSRKKLEEFRRLCQGQRLCKYWKSAEGLGGDVVKSLNQLIRTRPRVGWIRADDIEEISSKEILTLRRQVDNLQAEKSQSDIVAPGKEDLAQGEDRIDLRAKYWMESPPPGKPYDQASGIELDLATTWNDIFRWIAPAMNPSSDSSLLGERVGSLIKVAAKQVAKLAEYPKGVELLEPSFNIILRQFRSLQFIEVQTSSPGTFYSTEIYTLTKYGENLMAKLLAIKRPAVALKHD
jgi:hypothetical protein